MNHTLDNIDTRGMDWQTRAACADLPADVFFPNNPTGEEAYAEGRRECARCPVAGECLAYALKSDERYGLWGGLTPRQRELLRKRQGLVRTSATDASAERRRTDAAILKRYEAAGYTGIGAEIAAELGISIDALHARIRRARMHAAKQAAA